jgi:DNA-binding response OmpR family regulator
MYDAGGSIMNNAMLASDDANVCDRTATMLTELGWDVYVIAAEELLDDNLSVQVPQLILVDIEMRGGVGFDLILKARRRFADAFIIAATRGQDRDLWPGLVDMCGADRYMVGPVSKSKLSGLIEMALTRGNLEQSSAITLVTSGY